MAIFIRLARKQDVDEIKALLNKAQLHTDGVEQHLSRFVVVEHETDDPVDARKIVGTAGIERHGDDGLLRSWVMESETWNAQVGLDLIRVMIALARNEKLQRLFLLTTGSQPFFEFLGFSSVDWGAMPLSIQQAPHVQSYSSEIAIAMALELKTKTKKPD